MIYSFELFKWWLALFVIGVLFMPLSSIIFENFFDRGYIFSKTLGLGIITYIVFALGVAKMLPFTTLSVYGIAIAALIGNVLLFFRSKDSLKSSTLKIIAAEEILFFLGLFFWTIIRSHNSSIHGLEKFMDFGFVNSILRTTYFPPADMWLTPDSINYYYFGHLITALLIKATAVPASIAYNYMIATLFAFTYTCAFCLLLAFTNIGSAKLKVSALVGAVLAGGLLSLSGNLHTLYSLFVPYNTDHPVPVWNLLFTPFTFPNGYWYPNATRFIPYTIHEFPIYSFIVSDLHGHVLDIPFVLLSVGFIFSLFMKNNLRWSSLALLSLLVAIMYMTNAWDGFIYMLLASLAIMLINFNIFDRPVDKKQNLQKKRGGQGLFWRYIRQNAFSIGFLGMGFFFFSAPFNIHFKPFVSEIGVVCAPNFLVNLGRLGPFLFEANHCARSPLWQLLILYGFFYFFVASFLYFINTTKSKITRNDIFILLLIFLSTLLIIIPEFVYAKDIYPLHYRANTMFKLVYQAFMLLSLCSAYIIVRITKTSKNILFVFISLVFLVAVFSYPYFGVKSYYSDLSSPAQIDGLLYLKDLYPADYAAVNWINTHIQGQPVMLEAQGDSYTDYERVSANTGLPTVLGWTVHEWLWRGSYPAIAPRITEVQTIYDSADLQSTLDLLRKYNVAYVYIGGLEHQKYPTLDEEKFSRLGTLVYRNYGTHIYKISL